MRRLFSFTLLVWVVIGAAAARLPAAEKAFKEDYQMLGDGTRVLGLDPVRVEGIGLVVGLPNTGGDPQPGPYRDQILELMRKREVEHPETLLASHRVSVVLLRGFIPAGVRKGNTFDVEVYITPGDTETRSLKNGYLLPTDLKNKLNSKNGPVEGAALATVDGPITVMQSSVGKGDESSLKTGKILGRAKVKKDREFFISLDQGIRGGRRSKEIASHINSRFHSVDGGARQIGLATAKDDVRVELKLADPYKQNFQRYLLVVRRIPFRLSEAGQTALVRELKSDLTLPSKAYETALRMEALGPQSASALKEALSSSSQIVRFSAAEALAYLGDGHGIKVLADLAEKEPLYRAYALAALAANNLPSSRLRLLQLLHAPGAETRYGAFRALWTVDASEPSIMGEKLGDDFFLHVLETRQEPMVHIARSFRPEIVLFGGKQKLQPPFLLRIGENMIITSEGGGEKVLLASFQKSGQEPMREESSLLLADVIRKAAALGAKYPEIVDLLQQASTSSALEGRLEINALPKAVRLASLAAVGANDDRDAQQLPDGVPSMFQDQFSQSAPPRLTRGDRGEKEQEEPKKRSFWDAIFHRHAQ